jgi:hypothetical protein
MCSQCGGPVCYLGTLGDLDWFRCRNCGADERVAPTYDNKQEEEEESHA